MQKVGEAIKSEMRRGREGASLALLAVTDTRRVACVRDQHAPERGHERAIGVEKRVLGEGAQQVRLNHLGPGKRAT
eukprot:6191318-Pleurochrysis_carterae.AAC.2